MKKRGLFVLYSAVLVLFLIQSASSVQITSPWLYSFNTNGILNEAGTAPESTSPYWWINSGAELIISGGRGWTVQGDLLSNDVWRINYLSDNSLDTDNGYHPQNIFRLITKSEWQNSQETAYFQIKKDQLSSSPNRAEHNGLLLMSRYSDSDNLYYAGIRVDGNAIIKKKINGEYFTLDSNKIFPGTYNRILNPNLMPKNKWIGLRSEITTNPDNSVNIKLYMDLNWNNRWVLVAEATDASSPILNQGYAGIRTDFMDVEFDNFELRNI